jgi:CubicO group peptidase (beta-lactamase class C family)
MKRLSILFIVLSACQCLYAQYMPLAGRLDSLLNGAAASTFNGGVLVSQNGKTLYQRIQGFSTLEDRTPLQRNSQFVIGSISKQITAVLVLQEYDRGRLAIHVPIRRYLPELPQTWADTVTVHHLLIHMHGITELDKPLSFAPGTAYAYSQIGFDLLAQIIEKTSGLKFEQLAADLFQKCQMKNTVHPELYAGSSLANGYSEQDNGTLARETEHTSYVAAGGFISTLEDQVRWNTNLHSGKLLKESTYALMVTPQPGAVRQHPLFGTTAYGYGITVDRHDDLLQLGQTGFAPGFVSLNFYFPESKTSVVILSNTARELSDLAGTFKNHIKIWETVRAALLPEPETHKSTVNGG